MNLSLSLSLSRPSIPLPFLLLNIIYHVSFHFQGSHLVVWNHHVIGGVPPFPLETNTSPLANILIMRIIPTTACHAHRRSEGGCPLTCWNVTNFHLNPLNMGNFPPGRIFSITREAPLVNTLTTEALRPLGNFVINIAPRSCHSPSIDQICITRGAPPLKSEEWGEEMLGWHRFGFTLQKLRLSQQRRYLNYRGEMKDQVM